MLLVKKSSCVFIYSPLQGKWSKSCIKSQLRPQIKVTKSPSFQFVRIQLQILFPDSFVQYNILICTCLEIYQNKSIRENSELEITAFHLPWNTLALGLVVFVGLCIQWRLPKAWQKLLGGWLNQMHILACHQQTIILP